jgi:hypothetical protein
MTDVISIIYARLNNNLTTQHNQNASNSFQAALNQANLQYNTCLIEAWADYQNQINACNQGGGGNG